MIECVLCGHNALKRSFYAKGATYFRCLSCRSLLVGTTYAASDVFSNYSASYYEGDSHGTSDNRRGYPSYREAESTLVASFEDKLGLVRRFVSSGTLLDAGAAYGFFLKTASPHFRGKGIDVSPYAALTARSQVGVAVEAGDIEHTPFQDMEFDVIVMWDIIEHLLTPVGALREMNRVLKPGGYLFISTDDAAHWLPRVLGAKWWALGPPLHLCHCSKLGIARGVERAGFRLHSFESDLRRYSIAEIIRHFGVSYQSKMLTAMGTKLETTRIGRLVLSVKRPEQFVAIVQKPTDCT